MSENENKQANLARSDARHSLGREPFWPVRAEPILCHCVWCRNAPRRNGQLLVTHRCK